MKILLFAASVRSNLVCKNQETCQECLLASPDCVWCDVKGKKNYTKSDFFQHIQFFQLERRFNTYNYGF